MEAIDLHFHKSLRLRNDLLVVTFYAIHALELGDLNRIFTVPYFSLRSSGVEAEGHEGLSSTPTPAPTRTALVASILFSRLNSAHPFETKMAALNHLEDLTENNR